MALRVFLEFVLVNVCGIGRTPLKLVGIAVETDFPPLNRELFLDI